MHTVKENGAHGDGDALAWDSILSCDLLTSFPQTTLLIKLSLLHYLWIAIYCTSFDFVVTDKNSMAQFRHDTVPMMLI